MTIELSQEIQKRLSVHVASGAFESIEDVVAAALEAFPESEEGSSELSRALEKGIQELDAAQSIALEDFDREMRARYGMPG